ncbi:MAG: GTP 3',8-cyclase MoaA [Elusimicrobia bacterium]|nr:GTP 3',8-cyclase MoaA [Elusimicrobiota bacterium]
MTLVDGFGRSFRYLRLSVTDACDYRCRYCLPGGFHKEEAEPPLTLDEIRRLVAGFAALGFWKIRLTGGEPTVRGDLVDIVAACARAPGVRRVALSTNGARLAALAPALAAAGLSAVNVSVDSLDPARFRDVTGRDDLARVLDGVERALTLGLSVKLNTVLMKGVNDGELGAFTEFARARALDVRFIELMPTADNADFFTARHEKTAALAERLREDGWREAPRGEGDGPARRFIKEGWAGSIGVIAPYAKDFCASCNRLRVTSRGRLRLCLFSEGEHSLRDLLSDDGRAAGLRERVTSLLGLKEVSHYLPEGRLGDTRHFAAIGG